jgi:uncharacterized protein YbjT (DUF2867 family)
LWKAIVDAHELDACQRVTLEEACRAKDRLDKLDQLLRADVDTWAELVVDANSDGQVFELRVTQALSKANETANLMKQLLAALRLPDEAGKRPQQRGGGRGAYAPGPTGGKPTAGGARKVSSLERARAAKAGP